MSKKITLILLSMLILSGCSQGNISDQKLNEEIVQLKEENENLKERISFLEGSGTKDSAGEKAGELSSEIRVNESHFVRQDWDHDIDMKYVIKKYGYLETLVGYGDDGRITDGKFLVLETHVENTGKKENSVSRYCLVMDDQDREYECIDVKIFDKENEDPISEKRLKPGFETTAYLAFEVPSSFEIDRFICFRFFYDLEELQEQGGVIQIDTDQLEESQFDFIAE